MKANYQSLETSGSNTSDAPSAVVLHHHSFGYKVSPLLIFLSTMVLIILLGLTGYLSKELTDGTQGCLGPPFLYISHHESKNILKYTRDGCSISKDVLWYGSSMSPASSLRDMVIHPYKGIKDALYIANAGEQPFEAPKVLVFGSCSPWNGMRTYIDTLVNKDSSLGAQHTYSLTFDSSANMYVSFQHTDLILRFWNGTFRPTPTPHNLTYYSDVQSDDGPTKATPVLPNSHPPLVTEKSKEDLRLRRRFEGAGVMHAQHKSKFPTEAPPSDDQHSSPLPPTDTSPQSPSMSPATYPDSSQQPVLQPPSASSPTLASPQPSPSPAPQPKKAPSASAPVPAPAPATAPATFPITGDTSSFKYYEGTFLQFGAPGYHNDSAQGVRAVRWVASRQELWISNEDLHHVLIVDTRGRLVDKVKVKNPIGLYVDEDRHGMVFVGSKKTKTGSKGSGAVYGVDIATRQIVKTFTLLGGILSHPTGIVSFEDTLFVAEKTMNVVLTFNITNERYLKQIVSISCTGEDGLEQLTLSHC